MENVSLLAILDKPLCDRTLEERLILLEKRCDELENENHFLRVSLNGSMALSRSIEKTFAQQDERLSWCYRVLAQNYNFITQKIK